MMEQVYDNNVISTMMTWIDVLILAIIIYIYIGHHVIIFAYNLINYYMLVYVILILKKCLTTMKWQCK